METLVDDVGSSPLPNGIGRKTFDKAYVLSREAIIDGKDVQEDEFLLKNIEAFQKRCWKKPTNRFESV